MRRSWLLIPALIMTMAVAAAATAIAAVATNTATNVPGPWPAGLEIIRQHPFRWLAATTIVGLASAVVLWWLPRLIDRRQQEWVPAEQRPEPWVVHRPAEVD